MLRVKVMCAGCVERGPCLAWALEHEPVGVWGGTSAAERRRLRRDGAVVVAAFEDVAEPDAADLADLEPDDTLTSERAGQDARAASAGDFGERGRRLESPRSCGMCGEALAPGQQKWCSRSCQKKAAWRRNGRSVDTKRGSVDTPGPIHTQPFSVNRSGPFDQLAAVAQALPDGWRLEATAQTVVVTWSR
jgi:hypothetical protein